jgi:hypothetical protein
MRDYGSKLSRNRTAGRRPTPGFDLERWPESCATLKHLAEHSEFSRRLPWAANFRKFNSSRDTTSHFSA